MRCKSQGRLLKLKDGRYVVVPGWYYYNEAGGCSFNFSYAHSMEQKKIVFLESHMTMTAELAGDDWVPISSSIPQHVIPRPGLEDGIIFTLEQYADVFMKDDQIVGSVGHFEELYDNQKIKEYLYLQSDSSVIPPFNLEGVVNGEGTNSCS